MEAACAWPLALKIFRRNANVTYTCSLFLSHFDQKRPPLWSNGQSSWLQIRRSRFDSRHYQIFREVLGLKRGALSLVSVIEELLGRKSSGSSLESLEYGRRNPSRWPRGTLYPWKLALTSPTSSGRSVGIVRSRTQATELLVLLPKQVKTNFSQAVCRPFCLLRGPVDLTLPSRNAEFTDRHCSYVTLHTQKQIAM
jgi:hypothetical protein